MLLDAQTVRLTVTLWNGTPVIDHSYSAKDAALNNATPSVEIAQEDLSHDYVMKLAVSTRKVMTERQRELLAKATRLVRLALRCVLIGQRDRAALGEPFTCLTEREWKICQALEQPDGEKQIAESLNYSRHTLHGHVKSLYRKLQVQSRLQLLDLLKKTREGLRRRTLEDFGAGPEVPGQFEAPDHDVSI